MNARDKTINPGDEVWFYSPGFHHCYGSTTVEGIKESQCVLYAPIPQGVHPGAWMASAYHEPIGDVLREILAQYNEQFASSNDWRFWGPHYVRFEYGTFRLFPFGRWAEDRYRFEAREDYQMQEDERFWVFVVMP